MLKRNTSIPLYQQLKEQVLADIATGTLTTGERLPTEAELSAKYRVSRITVRNAVINLVKDGYLVKKQGKGTFVCAPKFERKFLHLLSFTAACLANGLIAQSRVIEKTAVADYRDVRQTLGLIGDDEILYIRRLRSAGGEPVMLENNYFSRSRFYFLINERLDGSLYDLLSARYQITPTRAGETTIEMVRAHDEVASLLEKPVGEPLFLLKTLILDQRERPVHYGEQYMVAERYKFSF